MKIDPPLPKPGDSEEVIEAKLDAWDSVEAEEAEEASDADDGIDSVLNGVTSDSKSSIGKTVLSTSKGMITSKIQEFIPSLLQTAISFIKKIIFR